VRIRLETETIYLIGMVVLSASLTWEIYWNNRLLRRLSEYERGIK